MDRYIFARSIHIYGQDNNFFNKIVKKIHFHNPFTLEIARVKNKPEQILQEVRNHDRYHLSENFCLKVFFLSDLNEIVDSKSLKCLPKRKSGEKQVRAL